MLPSTPQLLSTTRIPAAAGGAPFSGSGDVKSGAFAYWSVARGYNLAYATGSNPAMDLVDQAGANPITVNIKTNGLVDVPAINTWVAANSVTTIRVKKLYDQTGNSRHVSQATLANMPKLLLSHPALGNAAIPTMDFVAASSQSLASGATGLSQATGTFSIVSRQSHLASYSFGGLIQAGAFGPSHTGPNNTGLGGITMFAGSVPSTPCLDEIFTATQAVFNGASSFACINGVVGATVNPGASSLGSPFTIGLLNNSNPLTGQIAEIRFDASVWTSTDCQNEYANQLAFWFNRTAYEGFVASRCRRKASTDLTNGWMMARSAHIATENLTSVRVGFDNTFTSGTSTITQSIEYPAGTFTQIKWAGVASWTFRAGSQDTVLSDYATIAGGIPSGATFWVRTLWHNTSNASLYNTWQNTFLGEATTLSTTALTDLTMSGTVTNSGAFSAPPLCIIGVTTNASVILIGDSIASGSNDVEDTSNSATGRNGIVGYLARSFGVPFVNMAMSGEQANGNAAGIVRGFGSHLICEYGVNDFFVGAQSSAQLITRLHAHLDLRRPGMKVYQTTITPKSTTTDGYLTTTNQAVADPTDEPSRVTFNNALRGGTTGLTTLTAVIQAAAEFESSLNSGIWEASPTPPYTADGLHPSSSAHTKAVANGVVPTISWP